MSFITYLVINNNLGYFISINTFCVCSSSKFHITSKWCCETSGVIRKLGVLSISTPQLKWCLCHHHCIMHVGITISNWIILFCVSIFYPHWMMEISHSLLDKWYKNYLLNRLMYWTLLCLKPPNSTTLFFTKNKYYTSIFYLI